MRLSASTSIFLKQFPEYAASRRGAEDRTAGPAATDGEDAATTAVTPEEQIEAAYSVLLDALRDELPDRIIAAPWQLFEQLVVDLLVAMGYAAAGGIRPGPSPVPAMRAWTV